MSDRKSERLAKRGSNESEYAGPCGHSRTMNFILNMGESHWRFWRESDLGFNRFTQQTSYVRNRLGVCLWEEKRGSGEFTSLLQPSREEMVVASTLMVATQGVKHYNFFLVCIWLLWVSIGTCKIFNLSCGMQDLDS